MKSALAIRESLLLGGGLGVCQDLHLLYPSRLYQPLRTRLFIDFVAGQFTSLRGFEQPRLRHRP